MKIAMGIILAITLFYTMPAYAEEEAVLDWNDCVREAIKNNPDLISAEETLNQSEADKRITKSAIFPRISADFEGRTSETANSKSRTDSYSFALSGKQLLFDGFKTYNDIKSAKENIKSSQYNYAAVSSNIRLDLRTAFVELMRAQELMSLTGNIAMRRRQNLELIKLRYEAGREHRGSLLTAEADLARAEFEVTQAERSISLARRQISKALGFDKMKPIKVKGEFSINEYNGARPDFEYLTDSTPFLKVLTAEKEAARYGLQSAKADFFPKAYLNSSIGRVSSDWPPEQDEWSAGISVSLPLFEGGRRLAEVSKTKSRFRQAEADAQSGRDSVLVTLESTWKNLQDAVSNLSVQKKFLNAAEERAKIAGAQYENGLISFDDWVIIEDNLVNAGKAYLNSQADMLLAEARWIQAKGGTLEYDKK